MAKNVREFAHAQPKPPLKNVAASNATRLMKNRVYCEDALSVMSKWPKSCFDACVTDPPYNIARSRPGLPWAFSSHVTIESDWDRFLDGDYQKFTFDWLSEVCRVVKPNGNIFVFGSYHNIYLIGAIAQKLRLRFINSIIWAKPNAQPNITCRMFTESTEQVLWLCNNHERKAKNWTFNYETVKELNGGKQMRNFWEIPTTPPSERRFGKHPSQKPLLLMERIILAATNKNDAVLDCFCGTGSTLVACKKLGRKFVGIEREKKYCKIALARLKEISSVDRKKRTALLAKEANASHS